MYTKVSLRAKITRASKSVFVVGSDGVTGSSNKSGLTHPFHASRSCLRPSDCDPFSRGSVVRLQVEEHISGQVKREVFGTGMYDCLFFAQFVCLRVFLIIKKTAQGLHDKERKRFLTPLERSDDTKKITQLEFHEG